MVQVKLEEMDKIKGFFANFNDAMLFSCLEGNIGEVYVQDWDHANAALIVSQEYCYCGGDYTSPEGSYLIEHFFDVSQCDHVTALFPPDQTQWIDALMAHPVNHPEIVERYCIAFKHYDFDMDLLQRYIDALPEGYVMVPFNRELYELSLKEPWSSEFCDSFRSAEDFLEKGLGYAILKDGEFVAGASSMAVYSTGIEMKTETVEAHRRKGLAMAACAATIKECVRRGLYPSWDAVTTISRTMALKLGYEYAGEFDTVHLHRH